MEASKQFRNRRDAEHYFKLLDIDKNRKVSFAEVFAPIITQLSTLQVQQMTKDSVYTTDDMTLLRKCYEELKQQ